MNSTLSEIIVGEDTYTQREFSILLDSFLLAFHGAHNSHLLIYSQSLQAGSLISYLKKRK